MAVSVADLNVVEAEDGDGAEGKDEVRTVEIDTDAAVHNLSVP